MDTNIEDLTEDDIVADIGVLEDLTKRNPVPLADLDPESEPVRQFLHNLYTDEVFMKPSAYWRGTKTGFQFDHFASRILAIAERSGVRLWTQIPYQEEYDDGLGWEDDTQS